jgi:hypothetical protein
MPHSARRLRDVSLVELGDGSVVGMNGRVSLSVMKEQGQRVLGTLSVVGLCYFSVSSRCSPARTDTGERANLVRR